MSRYDLSAVLLAAPAAGYNKIHIPGHHMVCNGGCQPVIQSAAPPARQNSNSITLYHMAMIMLPLILNRTLLLCLDIPLAGITECMVHVCTALHT